MADEDDLGNFFDEINQIEETEAAEQPKQISIDQSSELQTSSKSVATERAIANGPTVVKQYGPQIVSKPAELVSKPAELVAVNRAIYTYGVSSNSTVEVSSTVARESSTENTEAEVSGSSNYQIKHASIGPSIGPVGPPTGPRPPSNSFPHSSSGGSNFSLHSFSTSYVTSTGDSILITLISRIYSRNKLTSILSSNYFSAPVAAPQMPKQDKTFVRTGAGEVWVDDTLKDWPENDYRIFVGDLGKETTTEMLAKIFQPYKSFAKAKVTQNSMHF